MSRDGPGLLLRDILGGDDPQIAAFASVVVEVSPDILVLTEMDYDAGLAALVALEQVLSARGQRYPHLFALRPNSGMATDLDMDGNGRLGEARDAQGYGRFAGDGGMAILSRLPLESDHVTDLSGLFWHDLLGATLPIRPDGTPFPSDAAQAAQRLSTTGHWIVPVQPQLGPTFSLLVSSSTPPVFDGPEDLNGLRNRDELRLWTQVLDGSFGAAPESFVLVANTNLDPVDGDGLTDAMAALLSDPRLIDPAPASLGGKAAADPGQGGDPGLDTADWPDGAPGNLRVSYVLPSRGWTVTGSGVFWPAPDDPLAAILGAEGLAAGPHHLVWVDVAR